MKIELARLLRNTYLEMSLPEGSLLLLENYRSVNGRANPVPALSMESKWDLFAIMGKAISDAIKDDQESQALELAEILANDEFRHETMGSLHIFF